MIDIKKKRNNPMLGSAPCSTKYLTISILFSLMAKLRGHAWGKNKFQKTKIDMNIRRTK